MIRVILVDDHKIFTEGLAHILGLESDITVVGQCQSAKELFAGMNSTEDVVVLLDINLGHESGLDICKNLSDNYPLAKVIAVSMYQEESFITKMLKNGAAGYLLKNTGREEFLKAIRAVSEGKSYQSAAITEIIMNGLSRQKNQERNLHELKFTRREKEILELIAKGQTTKSIANTLCISEKTVETHRSNLLAKFDVKNMVSLLKLALEYGYVK
ncbi:response regulator transcription factor [Flectobacillus sp. DC10W]|uniref:Response regulator transcription factor n=1 Tax=Flectobacillus longus TaxID=2984207 RepID=A0ABT6YS33_9BACT|nr:response regulator transcription factor [Flectobacillus longus]MDI9866386.1 response regulator transcription factor [Flectobacillus longus]